MKYIILFCAIFYSSPSSAQDCTKELLQKKPGTWKAGLTGSIDNVSATDLVREKSVIAGKNWIADPYGYTMYILRYICDGNNTDKSKYYVDAATPTTVNIGANSMALLNGLYAADLPDDYARGYSRLKAKPQKKDGYYFLGEEVVGILWATAGSSGSIFSPISGVKTDLGSLTVWSPVF